MYRIEKDLQPHSETYRNVRGIISELTALIESSKQSINDTIKQMESPVNGLTYNEDTLVYNDVPLPIKYLLILKSMVCALWLGTMNSTAMNEMVSWS